MVYDSNCQTKTPAHALSLGTGLAPITLGHPGDINRSAKLGQAGRLRTLQRGDRSGEVGGPQSLGCFGNRMGLYQGVDNPLEWLAKIEAIGNFFAKTVQFLLG